MLLNAIFNVIPYTGKPYQKISMFMIKKKPHIFIHSRYMYFVTLENLDMCILDSRTFSLKVTFSTVLILSNIGLKFSVKDLNWETDRQINVINS